jgi:hypothetical protein
LPDKIGPSAYKVPLLFLRVDLKERIPPLKNTKVKIASIVFKIVKCISTANFCLLYSVFRSRNYVDIAPFGTQ